MYTQFSIPLPAELRSNTLPETDGAASSSVHLLKTMPLGKCEKIPLPQRFDDQFDRPFWYGTVQ